MMQHPSDPRPPVQEPPPPQPIPPQPEPDDDDDGDDDEDEDDEDVGRGTRDGSSAGTKKTPPRRTAAFVERACRGVSTLARLRQGEMQDGLLSAGFAGFPEARKPALRRTVGGGAAGEGEPTYESASGRCHPKASGSYRTGQFPKG